MKKRLLLLFTWCILFCRMHAAPFSFLETIVTQPDGSRLTLYASGDEFYHWVHDKDGYTVLQGEDGYCYYAEKNDRGELVPSPFPVGKTPIADTDLRPWLKISKESYDIRRERLQPLARTRSMYQPQYASHKKPLNNIVIFISFQNVTTFSKKRSVYDSRFNSTTSSSGSLKDYYLEASYNNLTIQSHFFPQADLDAKDAGYVDFHTRNFYRTYNATTNPDGYKTGEESTMREHNLIQNAIDAMRSTIEKELTPDEIDNDNDGYVDNICFVVQGNSDGWSDLLWAHRWSLYTKECYIHGKRVMDYVFQPENQVTVNTLCHEMFHALGAPDLYHYSEESQNLDPVGEWDLMNSGWCHMGAYMKWMYAGKNWITEIPEITTTGRYSLVPLSQSPDNSCYKVSSSSADEYYVLEYRKKEGKYEKNIPRSGLLIYRINTTVSEGNRNGPPDEVYIYRPYGSLVENGFLDEAAYQTNAGAVMTDKTYPKPFLSDDSDGGLRITNLKVEDDKLSFDISITTTGIEAGQEADSFKMYLEENMLTIHSNDPVKSVVVTDLSGRSVMKRNDAASSLSLQELAPGVYIVSVTLASDKTYQQKIILK